MIEVQLEKILEKFVNNFDFLEALKQMVSELAGYEKDPDLEAHTSALLFVGHDTRKSSPRLAAAVTKAAELIGVKVVYFGEVATPMLYFFVRQYNVRVHHGGQALTKEQLVDLYFESYGTRFHRLMLHLNGGHKPKKDDRTHLVIDCSNGIGYQSSKRFYNQYMKDFFKVKFINTSDVEHLNAGCGAEHVHKEAKLPAHFPVETSVEGLSLDGDADRLVYFRNLDGQCIRIDGDKQSALLTLGVHKLMKEFFPKVEFTFGVVMTPYSNFGLVNLLKSNKIPFHVTPTGVKYTHRKAGEFDIGIYFEANGHGTMMIQESLLAKMKQHLPPKDADFALDMAQFVNNVRLLGHRRRRVQLPPDRGLPPVHVHDQGRFRRRLHPQKKPDVQAQGQEQAGRQDQRVDPATRGAQGTGALRPGDLQAAP